MNYNFITSIENTTTRRLTIAILGICAVPILFVILFAELIWKTMKAVVAIVKTQFKETKPTIINLIEYVKEVW
jgi:hypothetical protein